MSDLRNTSYRDNARRTTLDGQLLDERGNPVPDTTGWRQHPQQSRARRLEPYGRPDFVDQADSADAMMDFDPRYGQHLHHHAPNPGSNVTVNNNGQYYRPWKEELLISGWRTFGNFLGWPFRLIGDIISSIAHMLTGVLRMILIAVIAPSLLFAGYSFYQAHRDRPAAETAHEVGKAGVGLVGSVLGGIWDGIWHGSGDAVKSADPKPDQSDQAAPDDAPAKPIKHHKG